MSKYTYSPRAAAVLYDMDGEASVTADQVIVEDDAPVDTGLLDANGNKLWRVVHRLPCGFVSERMR